MGEVLTAPAPPMDSNTWTRAVAAALGFSGGRMPHNIQRRVESLGLTGHTVEQAVDIMKDES